MLVRKHSPDTAAPDPLLSLTPDHCSSPGLRAGGSQKTPGETVPSLGAAHRSAQGNGPCLVPVPSFPSRATGGTSYAPSARGGP